MSQFLVKLVVFLPLLSGIFSGIMCKKITNRLASIVVISAIFIVLLASILIFIKVGIERQIIHVNLLNWFTVETLEVNWGIYVDNLTAIMFIVVNLVSSVVHMYSLGYMSDDTNLPKFLSFLSLFTFFMNVLVASDNFIQLFFGWEGVGLCSYLLIGYYFHKDSANNAAVKAFIVNRISDCAFIIGIVMIYLYTGSVKFADVFAQGSYLAEYNIEMMGCNISVISIITILLFLGCMGKSAQLGFHVWLPDAMEGPTPVSALIHAATMVTAGVFLLARCSFLFEYSTYVLHLITIVGAITCLFAASIATVQTDIKKIIAYSTCSQLGYMFFACGVSAYHVAIFHLVTHAFFKALLFLCAGNIIHASGQQDIFKMGGMRSKLPITYTNFIIASSAIIGIFPLAGFYSKDAILEAAYMHGTAGKFAFILGIIAAILTAIYSLKIIILVFHGNTKLSKSIFEKLHESNIMNRSLILLVAGSLFSGMFGYYILKISHPQGYFINSIFNIDTVRGIGHPPMLITTLPLISGLFGIALAICIYSEKKLLHKILSNSILLKQRSQKYFSCVYYMLNNKFFFDEIYKLFIVKTFYRLSNLSLSIDINMIDVITTESAKKIVTFTNNIVARLQTGYLFHYTLYMVLSLTTCITFITVILLTKYSQ